MPLPDGANNIEGYEAHGGWIASAVDLVRFASAFDVGNKSPLLNGQVDPEMWARPDGRGRIRREEPAQGELLRLWLERSADRQRR